MQRSYILARSTLVAVASSLMLLGSMSSAFSDVTQELSTANTHAGYAMQATVLKTAQTHLQHVINCLVGPKGEDFDAKQANPCNAMGDGAIPDTSNAANKMQLTMAVTKAKHGIAASDLAAAQTDAKAVQEILSQVK